LTFWIGSTSLSTSHAFNFAHIPMVYRHLNLKSQKLTSKPVSSAKFQGCKLGANVRFRAPRRHSTNIARICLVLRLDNFDTW
jgi:hypothetical protein